MAVIFEWNGRIYGPFHDTCALVVETMNDHIGIELIEVTVEEARTYDTTCGVCGREV